ncbi:nitrite reductase (NADH) large subunit [Humitalea rosea]|uniref:Nitrite reductase (NADH) large subunit n=1 Tax=Humitalea rosea TaxID=990373 RepID=A0A2W7I8L6_9PROT|nr:FAD-dependent oxidoreductase [Humitalea rosea]PZW43034.1 nitrite reductase (NADH) large subunit [Humitalea rosea]
MTQILVIGAGPAGARCAQACAERGLRVKLVGAEPGLPYDRVALGKVLGGAAPSVLALPDPAARGIRYQPDTRITRLDRAARHAITADGGSLAYDRVVLATGSHAWRLPLPGADQPHVLLYRTLADVAAMRALARASVPAVVIGGGLLGLEAAAGLAALGCAVTVLHAMPWLMERQLNAEAAATLRRHLEARGLRFVMPAATAAIEPDAVVLKDGTRILADIVVLAVGVRPNVALGDGLAVKRGIIVDDYLRSTDPDILAIGECAEHHGQVCGLVTPALAMADVAAANLAGVPIRYVPPTLSATLKIAGLPVWSLGEIAPEGAEPITVEDADYGEYRGLWLRDGVLVGAVLCGDAADSGFYQGMLGRPIGDRAALALGPAWHKAAA